MIIDSSKIMDKVNHYMAVVGKRDFIDFKAAVVSSGELPVIDDFVIEGLVEIVSKSHKVFVGFSSEDGEYKYNLILSDGVDAEGIDVHVEAYLVSYCIFSILCSFANIPSTLTEKWLTKSNTSLSNLMYYAMNKKVPDETSKLNQTTGSCV